MIEAVGGLWGPLHGPFIYVIRARDLLYVGETQLHPAVRWGAHLAAGGSFRAGLDRHGDPEVDYFGDLSFAAFHCVGITARFAAAEVKMVTQAAEHALHVVLACDPTLVTGAFRLISDTVCTAPRRFRDWAYAEELAAAIAGILSSSSVCVDGRGAPTMRPVRAARSEASVPFSSAPAYGRTG